MTATLIRCGKCKSTHSSVSDVRACYVAVTGPLASVPTDIPMAHVAPSTRPPSTVGDGYYAIDIDDTVKFYRVRTETDPKSKWFNFTFLDVQASDVFHPIKASDTRKRVYAAIYMQGEIEGQQRYGQMIGKCGVCGRTLTDELSRERGIGPICWGRIYP